MSVVPTTVSAAELDRAAARLLEAAGSGTPCQPVRDLIGTSDLGAAYGVQQRITAARLATGTTVVGRKIGLTSPAVQEQLGVDTPDFGMLFADMACADGGTVPAGVLLQPRVEAEVAFVLRDDLVEGDLSTDQVAGAIDYAVAALEICDSRIAGWDISFGDTVADNASAGLYVLGTERRTLAELTPREVTMRMSVTGAEDAVGSGAASLGDPLVAVRWLALQAREYGDPLRAGQVILSGALGPMRACAPGATAHAAITGLGEVSINFAEQEQA